MCPMTHHDKMESQRIARKPAQFRVLVGIEVWVTATYDDAATKAADQVDVALRGYAINGPGVRGSSKVMGRV